MKRRATVGLIGAALLVVAGIVAIRSCGGSARPNVLLITVDTLRADYLHCYGQPLATSPNIDALAERSVLFERAIAASGYTGPSHAAIMTGRYPRHQSMGLSNGMLALGDVETLAGAFRDRGYDTAAFVSNVVLAARTGFNRGFDVYDDELPDPEPNRSNVFERRAPQTVDRARTWLATPRTKPYFLWVHFQDPHGPYTPPDEYTERLHVPAADGERDLPVLDDNGGQGGIPPYQLVDGPRRVSDYRRRYAGEIAYMDHYVGELLAAVDKIGPTIVVLTSDHGESFGENNFYFAHGHSAAPDLSHVPLIIHVPGWHALRRADPVSHVDIMPTLLGLAGLPPPGGVDGIALGSILKASAPFPERAVFCDVGYEVGAYWADVFLLAAIPEEKTWARELYYQSGRADRQHAIAGSEALTVMQTFRWDGGPTWSVCDPDPRLTAELAAYIGSGNVVGEPVTLDPAARERLRALGYAP